MPQYTPEQRNFLVMAYERYKGTRDFMPQINQEFQEELPGVEVPHRTNIVRMYKKQMTFYTSYNLNSILSPGATFSGRPKSFTSPDMMEVFTGILDRDSRINTARKNVLGLAKSSWSRVLKQLNYHPYKMVRAQILKQQDLQRRLLMWQNLVTLADDQLGHFCFTDEATFCLGEAS